MYCLELIISVIKFVTLLSRLIFGESKILNLLD